MRLTLKLATWAGLCVHASSSLSLPNAHLTTPSPPLPLVIWHGLGDNYDADGLKSVGELAQATHPGTYVYNIRLSDDASADRTASFLGNLSLQLSDVCIALATHPVLSKARAIDALGLSQGGIFLRGYVERCNNPQVRSLVTMGSPHNGIAKFKACEPTDWLCQGALGLVRTNTWSDFVQSRVVPAQYYRDGESEFENYLNHSNFLADINNERSAKNAAYRSNLTKLRHLAMYLFSEDTTIIPKESAWFQEVNSTSGAVTPLQKRPLYIEDWLGLKELDDAGRLQFRTAEGRHMQLGDKMLVDTFRDFFGPPDVGDDEMAMEL